MKRFACYLLIAVLSISAWAQINFNDNLPVDSNLRYGILPNGVTFYIYPLPGTGAVNLKLVTRIGSVVENENERGLAHFLEHMTFEGTKNYPHDSGSKILENFGLVSGSDFNAATMFDDTQFDIKNIDANEKSAVDQALRILRDWACNLTLSSKAIDKERGIVEEEWRTNRNYDQRMADSLCRSLLHGTPYATRMPIGSMQVIKNFKPSLLKDFYHKWYRPDLQAIIVVGDVNAAAIEHEVKTLFGTIPPKAQDAPARNEVIVPDHKGLDYHLFVDDEATSSQVGIFFMHDKTPRDLLMKKESYRLDAIKYMAASILAMRLDQNSTASDCAYSAASCADENFLLSRNKDALEIIGIAKEGMTLPTFDQLMTEARRAQLHGFTPSEWKRAKELWQANLDNMLKEADNQKRTDYADSFVDNFENGGDLCSYRESVMLMKQIIDQYVTLDDLNAFIKTHVKADNVAVTISGPKKEGITYPSREEVVKHFNEIYASTPAPLEETTGDTPLIEHQPTAGKIVKQTVDSSTNVTTMELSNGMKVLLKPTNFKNDEININGYSKGGYNLYHGKHDIALRAMNAVVECSGLGAHDYSSLNRDLLGKNVSFYFEISPTQESFTGQCVNANVETMMQLLYLYFTDVRKDEQSFKSTMSSLASHNSSVKNSPDYVFSDSVTSTMYPGYVYYKDLTAQEINAVNYDEVLQLYRERVSNPGDYVFTLVGSFNVDSIKPLIATYMASIPDNGVRDTAVKPVPMRHGEYTNQFTIPMATPKTSVNIDYFGPMQFSARNAIMMDMLENVITDQLNQKIREEASSTYGAQVTCDINENEPRFMISCSFDTNNEKQQELLDVTKKYLDGIVSKGVDENEYNKVYNQEVNQYNFRMQSNDFWIYALYLMARGINYKNDIIGTLGTMSNLKFNLFIKSLKYEDKLITVMQGTAK